MSDTTINQFAVLGYYVGLLAVLGCAAYVMCLIVRAYQHAARPLPPELLRTTPLQLRDPPPPPPPPGPGRPCLNCGVMNGSNDTHCRNCGKKL